MFENSEYDTGAGYNPQSGVFRDGSNNTVVDNKPTFEDYLKIQTPPTINSNLTE